MANKAFIDVAGNPYQAASAAQPEDSAVPFATAAYIASLPSPKAFTPYYNPLVSGVRAGFPPGNSVAANPGQSAFSALKGNSQYQNGFTFEADSIVGTDGITGRAPVINFARGHELNWFVPGNSGEGFKSVSVTSLRSLQSSGEQGITFQETTIDITRDGFKAFQIGTPLAGVNYPKLTPGTTGNPAILSVEAGETNAGLGLLPLGASAVTATRMFVGPQSFWSAMQSGNLARPRTQFVVGVSSFTNVAGTDIYPQMAISAGNQSGSVTTGTRAWYNTITVDEDNVAVAGGPQGLSLLYIGMGVGRVAGQAGSANAGGRNGIDANIFINSDVDIGAGSLFHVALAGNTTAKWKMGGVPGAYRGNVFGSLLAARLQNNALGSGPRYINSVIGVEIDVEQHANVTALWKVGAQIVEEKDSVRNADQQNIGLSMNNQGSATVIGWEQIFAIGAFNGQFPGAAHGQIMATLPNAPSATPTFAIADGINFTPRLIFSRSPFSSPGFYVDADGDVGGKSFGGTTLQTISGVNAKVSTVGSFTIIEAGSYDGAAAPVKPTFLVEAPPIAGVTATITVNTMFVTTFMGVSTGGTAYAPGEVLTQDTGTSGGVAATTMQLTVETVNGSGQPVNIRVSRAGDYSTQFNNPATFTSSGAGTGYTANFRWGILTTTNTAGTNYNEMKPPEVTLNSGLMHKEARFRTNMTAGTAIPLPLNPGVDRPITFTGQTSSAAAAAGTLLNAPVAGNPTHWQKVNINGVNYAIPCWPG